MQFQDLCRALGVLQGRVTPGTEVELVLHSNGSGRVQLRSKEFGVDSEPVYLWESEGQLALVMLAIDKLGASVDDLKV